MTFYAKCGTGSKPGCGRALFLTTVQCSASVSARALPFWPFLETHLLHLPRSHPFGRSTGLGERMPVFWFRLHEELAEGLWVPLAASLRHLKSGVTSLCDGTSSHPRERPMREFRFTLGQGLFKARSGALAHIISLKRLVHYKNTANLGGGSPGPHLLSHPLKVHLPF